MVTTSKLKCKSGCVWWHLWKVRMTCTCQGRNDAYITRRGTGYAAWVPALMSMSLESHTTTWTWEVPVCSLLDFLTAPASHTTRSTAMWSGLSSTYHNVPQCGPLSHLAEAHMSRALQNEHISGQCALSTITIYYILSTIISRHVYIFPF